MLERRYFDWKDRQGSIEMNVGVERMDIAQQ